MSLVLLACSFAFAQDGFVAFVSEGGERTLDLVVVAPGAKEKARLNLWGENGDLRVLSHWSYKIVLQDFFDNRLFIFDVATKKLTPVSFASDLVETSQLSAVDTRAGYTLFETSGLYYLLDFEKATLHALSVASYAYHASLSPDGTAALVLSLDGLWHFFTRRPAEPTLVDATAVTPPRFINATELGYITETSALKRVSSQSSPPETLAQDVATFFPADNALLFTTPEGSLYQLELTTLKSTLVHTFKGPVQVAWADGEHALVHSSEDKAWFYVTLAGGDPVRFGSLDGSLSVTRLEPQTRSVIFSSSLDISEPKTLRGLNLKTGETVHLGDFPGGYVSASTEDLALFTVFDPDNEGARLYRLDARGSATLLYEALAVAGVSSPDGRFAVVDASVGKPDHRGAEGVTLLLDENGRVIQQLGRGGHGVLWLFGAE